MQDDGVSVLRRGDNLMTTKSMKHTSGPSSRDPGPWKVEKFGADEANGKPNTGIKTHTGRWIAEVFNPDPNDANAKFIVRACNSHEDLLEACKDGLAIALMSGMNEKDDPVVKRIKAAIDKAST